MPSTVTGAHRREANLREERRPEAAAPRARGQAVPPPLPGLFILGPAGRTSSEPLRDGSRSARGPPGLPVHGTGPPARVCHTLAGSVLASRVGSCPGCSPPFPGTLFVLSPMKQQEPGAHSPLWRTDTLDPTAISPQHLGPTTSACQTSLPCIPNKRMGHPTTVLFGKLQCHISGRQDPGSRPARRRRGEWRAIPGSGREAPRTAGAVTGCPWAPGGDRSGAAAAIPMPWGPGLLSAAASGPARAGSRAAPVSAPKARAWGPHCGCAAVGPERGRREATPRDSRKTRERKHPEGAPDCLRPRAVPAEQVPGCSRGSGPRTVAAGDQRPSARSSGTGGRRRRTARSHLAWRAMSPSPSVGGSELHACAHT
ncbi:uncharacterized protein LOC109267851 isoform X1 [Panthera pardus]|uniref:Uncharacterized protein LOC109267851 isoform X1 n=1 Tax=Panthera pardus TaxID=9691 RepID=A0A9V1FP56_PANPR|nr:uncharacterized protein LOC109267851 isoform X1 [Panthera pardus]